LLFFGKGFSRKIGLDEGDKVAESRILQVAEGSEIMLSISMTVFRSSNSIALMANVASINQSIERFFLFLKGCLHSQLILK